MDGYKYIVHANKDECEIRDIEIDLAWCFECNSEHKHEVGIAKYNNTEYISFECLTCGAFELVEK